MIAYPNCKINLGLQVVGRRPDGYHELRTVFYPVGGNLRDELEITPLDESEPQMEQEGIALDSAPADNLCLRAWQLLHDEANIPPVRIRLRKVIPFGAGLGGGSSDAACTLKLLNTMFSLGLDARGLEQRAARLGADCPFFVRGRAAYATGIGDILHPIDIDLSAYDIRIAIPQGEHVSTREAYAGLHPSPEANHPDLRHELQRPIVEWRSRVVNDFEQSIFATHPAIADLKEQMYADGALYASMTGSGAAVYGIFAKQK